MFGLFEKIGAERGLHWSEAALLAFATIIAIGLIGEYQKDRDERWKGLSDVFELLVIAGVVGEVVFDGLIFGFSGRLDELRDNSINDAGIHATAAIVQSTEAQLQAGKAYEAFGTANLEVARLNKITADQAKRIIDLEIQFGVRVPKVETSIGNLQTAVQQTAARERPQDIDEGDLRRATSGLKRDLRSVTLIRIGDPVAGKYATNLGAALKKLKPPFAVRFIDLAGSRFDGVIVCENGAGDIKVGKALKRAVIASEIKKITAEECSQPVPATAPQGPFSVFGAPNPQPTGTLIFVGHRRLPPPP